MLQRVGQAIDIRDGEAGKIALQGLQPGVKLGKLVVDISLDRAGDIHKLRFESSHPLPQRTVPQASERHQRLDRFVHARQRSAQPGNVCNRQRAKLIL